MGLQILLLVVIVSIISYGLYELLLKELVLKSISQRKDKSKSNNDLIPQEKVAASSDRYEPSKVLNENAVISGMDVDTMKEDKPKVTLMKNKISGSTTNVLMLKDKIKSSEIISIYIFPQNKKDVDGKILYLALKSLNLVFSDTGIFHRVEDIKSSKQAQFSLALSKEPGVFDLDKMFESSYPGVVLFMVLNSPSSPMFAFEEMLSTARKLSCRLMGDLCDASMNKLTPQSIESTRDKVREYQRKKVFSKEEQLLEV